MAKYQETRVATGPDGCVDLIRDEQGREYYTAKFYPDEYTSTQRFSIGCLRGAKRYAGIS